MAVTIDSLNALVQDNYIPVWINNIFDSNVFTPRALGKAQKESTTKLIHIPIQYKKNTANGSIGRLGIMNLDVPEVGTAATWNPITLYQTLSLAWEDFIEYNSELAVKNGVSAFMKNAEESFKEMVSAKMFQLNAAQSSTDFDGLDTLISDAVDCGNLSYSTNSWWNSQRLTSSDFGSTAISTEAVLVDPSSAGFIEKILRKLYSLTLYGGSAPTVFVTSKYLFDLLDQVVSDSVNRPISVKKSGSAVERMGYMGFDAMQFRGVPIISDAQLYTSQASDTAGRIYAIDEETLKFYVNSAGNMAYTPFKEPVDQNAMTAKILWRGANTVSQRRKQGVVTGLASQY